MRKLLSHIIMNSELTKTEVELKCGFNKLSNNAKDFYFRFGSNLFYKLSKLLITTIYRTSNTINEQVISLSIRFPL